MSAWPSAASELRVPRGTGTLRQRTLQLEQQPQTSFVVCWLFADVGREDRVHVLDQVLGLEDGAQPVAHVVDLVIHWSYRRRHALSTSEILIQVLRRIMISAG